MAIDTDGVANFDPPISIGRRRSIVTDAATYLLRTGEGRLARVVVWGVGTTWTLDFYDEIVGSGSKIWGWVSADGKTNAELNIPVKTGLVVVSGGTAGGATIVWE